MTLATPDKVIAGHLEPGTEVFTFAIVTIGVMNDGVDFRRLDDKNLPLTHRANPSTSDAPGLDLAPHLRGAVA